MQPRRTSTRQRAAFFTGALLLTLSACASAPGDPATSPAVSASPSATPAPAATPGATVNAPSQADAAFSAFSAKFLADTLERSPTRATGAGEHRFDGRWPDLSVEGDAKDRAFVEATRKQLASMPREALSEQNRVDRDLIDNVLQEWLFSIDELREPTWDPMGYTSLIGDGLDPLITREFAPIDERMRSLQGRLEGIPALVEAAKKRLKNPPKVFTETAIQQNKGLIALCEGELAESFAKVPAQKAALEAAAKKAAAALHDLQTFFEKDLLARSTGDFRIGRARFEKKLRFSLQDPVDIDAVAQGARALLTKTQGEMVETGKELWPSLFKEPLPPSGTPAEQKALIKKVLDKLGEDHPSNDTIVGESKALLEQATKFVRDHDLVRVPTEPCTVIEMPEYRRGVAVAYCDSSGPLEQKQETFFAISPTPKDWPEKRAASFYREYNRSMLADLTIHEAMPGHFLQLMHNNTFSSKVRAVFSSGAFVEGWAVYTEWLMSKYGFGGPKVRMSRQKMVLRLATNAILDHEVHAGTMDEKAALDLMMNEAFQEEGEAVGKWKRARLSSAQLTTYYYGFTEMMKLRQAFEKAPDFKERPYHDRLLSHGSPSLKALRELMGQK